ncbi:MAG TPA: hypothetical protein VGM86_30550 [Thermoanaerobaculia bacterium]
MIRSRFAMAMLLLAALPARGADDDRSTEILRYECRTDVARRETTLFANGTIRLRKGQIGNEKMGLAELAPDKLEGFLNRLAAEDLSEAKSPDKGPEGAWIERCELRLQLPGKDLQTFQLGQYDRLPLNLSHVVHIAQELEKKVTIVKEAGDLPAGYEPRPGDVLKHAGDGNRFRVVAFTSDGKGIELEGIDQPIELYVPKDQLRKKFTALLSREE